MKMVEQYLEMVDFNRPTFILELFEIGRLSTPEDKSSALRGRFDLAVSALVTWDKSQIELRNVEGIEDVQRLIEGELIEVTEKEQLEDELALLNDDKHLLWHERPRANDYWTVANEMADVLVFVVMPGNLGKALGPGASNVKKLGFMFKKRLRIIEFNDDPVRFVSNLIYPIRAREIVLEDDSVVIRTDNMRDKGQVFGRERSNLKKIQMIVSKYFPLAVKIE